MEGILRTSISFTVDYRMDSSYQQAQVVGRASSTTSAALCRHATIGAVALLRSATAVELLATGGLDWATCTKDFWLAALILLHIIGVTIAEVRTKQGVVSAMISGEKVLYAPPADPDSTPPTDKEEP